MERLQRLRESVARSGAGGSDGVAPDWLAVERIENEFDAALQSDPSLMEADMQRLLRGDSGVPFASSVQKQLSVGNAAAAGGGNQQPNQASAKPSQANSLPVRPTHV